MSILDRIPKLEVCCGCVTDLKTAAAIIAVLGIVRFFFCRIKWDTYILSYLEYF